MATKRKVTTKPDANWWVKFDPNAWLTDMALRRVGLAAKGLWIEMLMVAFKAPVRGVLPGDVEVLARVLGYPVMEVAQALGELEQAGVFSRGAAVHDELEPTDIVCRRMWREYWGKARMAEGGRRSGAVRRGEAPEGRPKVALKVTRSLCEGDPKVEEDITATTTTGCEESAGRLDEAKAPIVRVRERVRESTTLRPEGSGAEPAARGSADFPPPGAEEPRGPERVGDILRRMGFADAPTPGSTDREGLEAHVRATVAAALGPGSEAHWGWWWDRVAPVLAGEPGGAEALGVWVHEIRRAGNPRTAHEHGIEDPGAWLAARVRGWAKTQGVALPLPGQPRNGVAS